MSPSVATVIYRWQDSSSDVTSSKVLGRYTYMYVG